MIKQGKLRVVVDTNLFISALISENTLPSKLLNSWRNNQYVLLTSYEALEEIEATAKRGQIKSSFVFSYEKTFLLIAELKRGAEIIQPIKIDKLPIHSRDPKDDFLLALAIVGKADYLITGDKDLLVLKNDPAMGDLKIRTAANFLSELAIS